MIVLGLLLAVLYVGLGWRMAPARGWAWYIWACLSFDLVTGGAVWTWSRDASA